MEGKKIRKGKGKKWGGKREEREKKRGEGRRAPFPIHISHYATVVIVAEAG